MAAGKTTPELWSLKRLAASLDGSDSQIVLEVPSFQRQFVWDERKQSELINSIRAGFPIGAIIICNSGESEPDGRPIYFLVDGLQRSLTIKAHADNPFFDATGSGDLIIEGDEFDKLAEHFSCRDDSAKLAAAVARFLKSVKKPGVEDWQAENLLAVCEEDLKVTIESKSRSQTRNAAHNLMEKIRSDSGKILDTNLAVLRAEVPVNKINEVFRRINDSGVALTRYQIWAATWLRDQVVTKNLEILDCIEDKRRAREKELKNYSIRLQNRKSLSLYDYLDGLGRVLASRYSFLFRSITKATDETPHAFVIAALVHRLRIDKKLEHELPRLMRAEKLDDDLIETGRFEEELFAAIDVAAIALAPLLSFKTYDFDRKREKHEFMHSDYFIAAFSSWLSVALKDDPKLKKSLGGSLLLHYVFEQISPAEKSHATDVQAFESVWTSLGKDADGLDRFVKNPLWLNPVSKEQFATRLDQWFESDLNSNLSDGVKRRAPSLATKLLLRLVMLQRSKAAHAQISYEVDHLVPWSRFKAWIEHDESPYGWPINSIANLALVPRVSNRGKGDATVVEWLMKSAKASKDEKYIRDALVLDGELLAKFDLKSGFIVTEAEYRKLLAARWVLVRQVIIDALFSDAWKK